MPVSLNNSKDIVANSISIIKGNETIDVMETIEAVQGQGIVSSTLNSLLDAKVDDVEMANYATKTTTYTKTDVDAKFTDIISGAPNALNTLKELSDALGANPSFSTTVLNQISSKANATDVYTKTAVNGLLDEKADLFTLMAPLSFLLDPQNPDQNKIQADVYNKATVDTALAAKANTLDTYTKSQVDASLGLKAPLANPTFTGTVTIPAMTFNNSNLQTTLDGKAPKASPTFTGTATIPLITSGVISPPTGSSLHLGGDTVTDGDLAIASGGTLNVDTIGKTTPTVTDLTITDPTKILGNLTIGTAAANRTLTVYGNTTMNGNATTPTLSVNTIDTIADTTNQFATSYPDLQVSRSVNIGSIADQLSGGQRNLNVFGNAIVNGNTTVLGTLGTVGVTTLGDDLNVGTTEMQTQGNSANLNVYGAANVLGNVTIGTPTANRFSTVNGTFSTTDTITSGGNVTVLGNRADVIAHIKNSQLNGFSSLILDTTSGVGQLWSGQNDGLNIVTNTAHPIRFNANRWAAGNLVSLEIQGTGTRNVVINSPLIYKPYASLLVTTTSGVVSVTNFGYCNLTASSVTRVGTGSKGYTITFPAAHPSGANFAVFATAQTGASSTWDGTNDFIITAKVESGGTGMSIWCRRPGISGATASGFTDGSFYVHSVP